MTMMTIVTNQWPFFQATIREWQRLSPNGSIVYATNCKLLQLTLSFTGFNAYEVRVIGCASIGSHVGAFRLPVLTRKQSSPEQKLRQCAVLRAKLYQS